jgi:luciferase family oxidoreductase group 1
MKLMVPFSVLDLAPIVQDEDATRSLAHTRDLARHAEALGYRWFWLAEHHNMSGIASAATAVVIGHVADGTSTIRVGAGGVMLPNHAPLVIAEQFGTLEALHPGRIDLGVGRAPGTDQITAHALRRNLNGDVDQFPRDVMELIAYFRDPQPGQIVRAIPGAGLKVPVWMLGSSTFGAHLAAVLGRPYAFASHFAPAQMMEAIAVYRQEFRPSEQLNRPYVMLGMNLVAADTDEEAAFLATSLKQAFLNLRSGTPGQLPPPVDDLERRYEASALAGIQQVFSAAVVGSPQTVRRGLVDFINRTGADELMLTAQIFDHAARLRSFEIAAEMRDSLVAAA